MIRKILSIPLRRGWRSVRLFSDHKYSNKTSKEIEKQVLDQKWNKLQADYKALDSTFGLQVPPT